MSAAQVHALDRSGGLGPRPDNVMPAAVVRVVESVHYNPDNTPAPTEREAGARQV